MRSTIKRKNLRRLASLSALGAGAIAATVGTADADVVKVDVDQKLTLGIESGVNQGPIPVPLPGGAQLSIFTFAPLHTGGHETFTGGVVRQKAFQTTNRRLLYVGAKGNASLRAMRAGGDLYAFGPTAIHSVSRGVTWNGALGGTPAVGACFGDRCLVGARLSHREGGTQTLIETTFNPVSRVIGRGATTGVSRIYENFQPNGYFLFRFLDSGTPLYGWGQLSFSSSSGGGPDSFVFMDYAYDTTGAKIGAGELAPVPEPSETLPLALTALVLGAAGIRRWRAAKIS